MMENVVEFNGTSHSPIEIRKDEKLCYKPGQINFDPNLLELSGVWHHITVEHSQAYIKEEILNSFFELITEEEFFPVAYNTGFIWDTFLVRLNPDALKILFKKNLKVPIRNFYMNLTIHLNVANYVSGQIVPMLLLQNTLQNISSECQHNGHSNVLILDNLAERPELEYVAFNFSNLGALKMLCQAIAKINNSSVNTISLSNNNIVFLEPMKILKQLGNIAVLNLSKNNISDIQQIHALVDLDLIQLSIADNPIESIKNIETELKELLPSLTQLDNFYFYATDDSNKTGEDGISNLEFGETIRPDDIDKAGFSFQKYKASKKWHQITLSHTGNYTKTQLINALFQITNDFSMDFYPCYYTRELNQDDFFVINCYNALFELVKHRLVLIDPKTQQKMASIILKMNRGVYKHGQVIPKAHITKKIIECYDRNTGVLNLEKASDNIPMNLVAFDITCPRVIEDIFSNFANAFGSSCLVIKLGHNNIESLKGYGPLDLYTKLKLLDLSHNNLKIFDDLAGLPRVCRIPEVILNGNPLCGRYPTSADYINQIKKFFPLLISIDTVPFIFKNSHYIRFQNYFCNSKASMFIDPFIKEYFRFFDSRQRDALAPLYNPKAKFSISFNFEGTKAIDTGGRFSQYRSMTRNIKLCFDPQQNLFIGVDDIMRIFKEIPKTQHDLHSFQVDSPVSANNTMTFVIFGVLKEFGFCEAISQPIILAFTRTFVFRRVPSERGIYCKLQKYEIYNDHLHLQMPTSSQILTAFKIKPPPAQLKLEKIRKEEVIAIFMEFTRLKKEHCLRILSENDNDLKKSIAVFREMHEKQTIQNDWFEDENTAAPIFTRR